MSLLPATSHRDPTHPFWASVTGESGINSIEAGDGITVADGSGPTVTITNDGVRTITAGTGITATGTNTVTLTNTGVTSVTGANGITVSASTGAVTITNNASTDIWPLPAITPQDILSATPTALATKSLGKLYNYAEGYGFIQTTGGVFGSPPQVTVYLSSGGSAAPLDPAKSVGYILSPVNGARTNLTGYFYDLSAIKHYDSTGFTSITFTWLVSTGGQNLAVIPVGSNTEVTNSTTANVVTTKLTTSRVGAAGFKFFTT